MKKEAKPTSLGQVRKRMIAKELQLLERKWRIMGMLREGKVRFVLPQKTF